MRQRLLYATLALSLTHSGFGQTYTIETIAGGGWDIPGATAHFSHLSGIAIDGDRNVFIALSAYSVVIRMDPNGQLSLVAGNGTQGFSGDNGPASLAQLAGPTAVSVDAAGNVYIADGGNNRIRKVSGGVISTVAGGGLASPGDNGPATDARLGLGSEYGLASDASGNIYFVDSTRIRKVSGGIITTVAGGGFGTGDNVAATSVFISPGGIAVDGAGQLYFADICANRIRRVSNGMITTVAGNGTATLLACARPAAGADSGSATGVPLNGPAGVAVDAAGDVYFMEGAVSGAGVPARARKVSKGAITTVAGGSMAPPFGSSMADNIAATSAVLGIPGSIAVDTAGNIYLSDEYWVAFLNGLGPAPELGRLRNVTNGVITTIAGTSGDSVPAADAQLNLPAGLALDRAGNLYVADSSNNIVREISRGGIDTIGGNRAAGFQSGFGQSVDLNDPQAVAIDPGGNIYIGETGSVVVSTNGFITTVADMVLRASSVAVDDAGSLFFADWTGNRISKVSNGVISTIAGDGTSGFSGDNGPAVSAQLAGPSSIALDGAGNLYVTDTGNQRVRRISNGMITTVAGNGTAGFSGDGADATSARLNLSPLFLPQFGSGFIPVDQLPRFPQLPTGIALDASGNLYIVDVGNHCVRKVSDGVITTIAGTGVPGYSGDGGPAVDAQLNNPSGIAVDATGKIYVSDSSNGRIRMLTPDCASGVSSSPIESAASAGTFPITLQTDTSCYSLSPHCGAGW